MKLRGINLGNILGASGVQGPFGKGYWFHFLYQWLFGLNFDGMTFVAKTVTLKPRKGNIKGGLREAIFPSWARINFWHGTMLNAMGLPNDGIEATLDAWEWQKRKKPFMISIAAVEDSQSKRMDELKAMVDHIGPIKNSFEAPFGVQVNLSCPNTGHDTSALIKESQEALEILSKLNVPLMPKYSIASAPIKAIVELEKNQHCDAICVSNTLPFGWEGVDWKKAWGTKKSPIARLGGGGLSGKDLCPLVCRWIMYVREAGFEKPINGGGGILCCDDVRYYCAAGASSVFLGSCAVLRPWRVKRIIRLANSLTW